jgi:hypothetical protein
VAAAEGVCKNREKVLAKNISQNNIFVQFEYAIILISYPNY